MAVALPSWSALVSRRHLAHTSILFLGVVIFVSDSFMVAAILPSAVQEIGGVAFYTWSAMLYTVSATLGTACGGFLAVTYGMRRSALTGVLLVLLGNAGGAVAPTMTVFLLTRVVHGLGGGVLVAQAWGIGGSFYPEPLRPRVVTAISVAHGVGALVGPVVGGAFATIGWWRGAFWATVPVIVVLAGLVWRFLPPREAGGKAARLPLLRLLLLGAAVLCVGASGQVGWLTLRLLAVGAAAILVHMTLHLDARAATRLFPSRALSLAHAIGTALWIVLLFTVTTGYTVVLLPLAVQVLHGVSPLFAGYFHAVLSVAWTAFAILSAKFEGDAVRRAILVGPILIAGGVVGLAFLVVAGPVALLAVFVAMMGAGMGLCFAHITHWTMSFARPDEAKVTASAVPTMNSLGRGFGAAGAGLVANAAGLSAGVSTATVASAAAWVYGSAVLLPAVILLLSLRLLRLRRRSYGESAQIPTPDGAARPG